MNLSAIVKEHYPNGFYKNNNTTLIPTQGVEYRPNNELGYIQLFKSKDDRTFKDIFILRTHLPVFQERMVRFVYDNIADAIDDFSEIIGQKVDWVAQANRIGRY